jgi:F0F1-type ATP synthase assembly protein I
VDVLRTKRELNQGGADAFSRAFELAASVVIFVGAGWWIDGRAHTRPLFIVLFAVFAIVGNLVKLWYAYEAEMKRHEAAHRRAGQP